MFASDGTTYGAKMHKAADTGMLNRLNPLIKTTGSATAADSNLNWVDAPAVASNFMFTDVDTNHAGGLGTWVTYNTADSDQAIRGTVDSTVALAAFEAGNALYAGYSTAETTYNGKADTYNKAAKDYNDEVEAQELDKPETKVPVRPCAPTAPIAWAGLSVDASTDADFASNAAGKGPKTTGGMMVRPQAKSATNRGRRLGWLAT